MIVRVLKNRCGFFLTAVFLTLPPASGQTSKGTIAGTITDPTGSAISGATVTAKDVLGGETRTVKTGSNGEYRIESVTPSTYDVTASAQGFSQKTVNNLNVQGSVVTSLNISLEVGAISQSLQVEAAGTPIQTESGDLSGNISTPEIAKLPINSLNPIELVLTQPGTVSVASRDSFTNGIGFSEDGLRPSGQ